MKNLVIIVLLTFTLNNLYGQQRDPGERINIKKKEFLVQRLNLDESSSKSFLSVYDEYHNKRKDIRIEMSQNQLSFRKSELSDAEAKKVINAEVNLKGKMVELEREYNDRFLKIISPQQLIEMYKAEDDFNRMMTERVRENSRNHNGGRMQERENIPPRPERPERPARPMQPDLNQN